jgi:predicted kinase
MAGPDLPLLVVVTGPPGAGKTQIARAVAERLGLPLVAKDTFKELLWERLGAEDREASRQLGRASFDLVFLLVAELLENGVSVVAEGNFGTSEPFRALPAARVLQLHVSAKPETLLARYRNRTERHPAHPDVDYEPEIAARMWRDDWKPLEIGGELLEIDTTEFPDLEALADRVASWAAGCSPSGAPGDRPSSGRRAG